MRRSLVILGFAALAACSDSDVDSADDQLTASIAFHGATHASSLGAPASSIVLKAPSNAVAGDVEIAAIDSSGATVTAPSGWSHALGASETGLSLDLFTHVVAKGDPASVTFALSASRSVVGALAAYSGVNHATPIDDAQTIGYATATASPRTTTVTACAADDVVVTVFANEVNAPAAATWTPPNNQNERADVATSRSSATNVSLELNDLGPKPTAGTYGSFAAQSSVAGVAIAGVLTLLPAGASCGTSGGDAGSNDAVATQDGGPPGSIAVKGTSSMSGASQVTFTTGPTTTASGDWLVAQVVARGASATSAPDATWTKIAEQQDGSGDVLQTVWSKPASGASSGAGTWSATGASSILVTLADVSGAGAVRASAGAGADAVIDESAPALSGTQSGDLELVFAATNTGARPWADRGTLFGVIPSGSVPAKWVDQATLHTFEKIVGRKMAYGHSWLPWSFGSGFPNSTTTGPNSDWIEGRMSVFSWPSELTWPDGGANGNGDPTTTLTNIASGQYDSVIAANAQVLKSWGQPAWFRLFCEMNGGDHPWEVGHQSNIASSGAPAAYEKAFIDAWRRIWIITKGSPADASNAGMNVTTFVHADNVLFHFNPQTYQTIATVPREALWPGDAYVDAAGTELYMRSASGENTFDAHMTDTSSGNGTHEPLYATFGPGGSLNQTWTGMLGNGEGGNGGIAGSMASMLDPTKGLGVRTAWKFFTYWNGGTSTIDNQSASAQNDLKTFANDPWMNPTLDVTFATPAGFDDVVQARAATGAAGVGYGAAQAGAMIATRPVGGTSAAAAPVQAFGFGKMSVIAVDLTP